MRMEIAFQLALAIGSFTSRSAQGFVTSPTTLLPVRSSSSCVLAIGQQGWDNENFLGSLSGGSDAIDAANQKYQAHSEHRAKHQEWRQQQQARNEGQELQASNQGASEGAAAEEGQGGSRFKEMMEKGQQARPAASAEGGSGPILYNPMQGLPSPSQQQAPAAPAAAPSEDDLSVQEQAQLFQKFMNMQQQGGEANQPASAPQKPGKKVGRNRDADTIANTADVYFAQLKRDSTVRTIARYEGDDDTANAVFEDEGVKDLENVIKTNPYLKE